MGFLNFRKIREKGKTIGYENDWMSFYPGFKKWNFTIAPAGYFDNRAQINFCIYITTLLRDSQYTND